MPRSRFACSLPIWIAVCVAGSPAPAQTMVEYGHMTAGAAKGAAGLRKASPAGSMRRLGDALSSPRTASGRRSAGPADAPLASVRYPAAPLTVLRVDWDGQDGLEGPESETSQKNFVLESEPRPAAAPAPPGLSERGLIRGMTLSEVSKILGDPSIRAAGLQGRGYDQKLLFALSEGWRVTVFALRGRVTAFLPSAAPQKSARNVLQASDSVIP